MTKRKPQGFRRYGEKTFDTMSGRIPWNTNNSNASEIYRNPQVKKSETPPQNFRKQKRK